MADYIPAPDAEFNAWQQNFVTYTNANLVNLGLVTPSQTSQIQITSPHRGPAAGLSPPWSLGPSVPSSRSLRAAAG